MTERTRLPFVTLILLIANMALAFLLVWKPGLVGRFGFDINHASPLTAFTSLFLHENVMHLLGNMIFLAAVGSAVELATGAGRFLVVYLVSGLVGVIAHFLFSPRLEDALPLIGASGCIAGCAGYYCVRYLRLRVPLAPKFGASVLAVTLIWLALQIIGAFVRIDAGDAGTAFWAHIGGFVAGLLLSTVFRSPDLAQLKLKHAVLEQMNNRSPAAALVALNKHVEEHPDDPKGWKELASVHQTMGHSKEEVAALKKWFELAPDSDRREALSRLAKLNALGSFTSLRRLKLAETVAEDDPSLAEALLESVAADANDPQCPEALLALGGLLKPQSEEKANAVFKILENRFPLHPATELAKSRGWL